MDFVVKMVAMIKHALAHAHAQGRRVVIIILKIDPTTLTPRGLVPCFLKPIVLMITD